MERPVLFQLCMLTAYVLNAQPTFTRMYYASPSLRFNLIELPSGSILAGMAETHLLSSTGHHTHISAYLGGNTYGNVSMIYRGSNMVYFTTKTVLVPCPGTTATGVHPVIGTMDSLGSVSSLRQYELNSGPCSNGSSGLEVTADGDAIIWGRSHDFYALRTDADLELLWAKRVYRNGSFSFIKELPGGDLLAGINMDTAGVVVARMNADGDFLWAKSYIRPNGIVHDALIESEDSFIITGFTDSLETTGPFGPPPPLTFQPKLFMMKLDGDGDVQWCRGWRSPTNLWYTPRRARIERTLDGRYVILANIAPESIHIGFRPFLMKIDANGEPLWTRSVGRTNYTYLTQDLLPYSDGGFLISGVIYGNMPNGSNGLLYIYKADSLGHFPCWEHEQPVQGYELFPVDSAFTLTAENMPATVTSIVVNDSILDPNIYTTFDGCTFNTGLPDPRTTRRPMAVYPNPTPGRFTLEVTDPLLKDSYYSVYDALGKLFYQRPLPAGATVEEVDLSRFERGTYVLKLTDPQGVRWERVVLE